MARDPYTTGPVAFDPAMVAAFNEAQERAKNAYAGRAVRAEVVTLPARPVAAPEPAAVVPVPGHRRRTNDLPHAGDCAGTLCPSCGCCGHCTAECPCPDGCTDPECQCAEATA